MSCSVTDFGLLSTGEQTHLFTLTNRSGASVSLSDYGATLVKCLVPDKAGVLADVTLGFDSVTTYTGNAGSIGGLCGRFANRIAYGELVIDGKTYQLPINDGKHHLHGGVPGFNQVLWTGEAAEDSVTFTLVSPDGDNGYPGTVKVRVTYTWTEDNVLRIAYCAETDAPTVINLTSHAYWCMDGADGRTARDTLVKINASYFTPITPEVIPDGRVLPVEGAVDFRKEKSVAAGLAETCDQLTYGTGFDCNFIIDGEGLREAATLTGPASGRRLSVYTTEPGMQLYTGQHLGNFIGKGGAVYAPGTGIAVETQHFPDTPHHPEWPSVMLLPGKPFTSLTEFRFDCVK